MKDERSPAALGHRLDYSKPQPRLASLPSVMAHTGYCVRDLRRAMLVGRDRFIGKRGNPWPFSTGKT